MTHRWLLVLSCVLAAVPTDALADFRWRDRALSIEYLGAQSIETSAWQQQRLTIQPSAVASFSRRWRATLKGRVEVANGAGDDYGLGTLATYSPLARPWAPNDRVRMEFDELSLEYRGRRNRVSVGKLIRPWGALDGIRVLDQLDAARNRDFLFLEQRPDRLSRYGIAALHRSNDWELEAVALLDPTVNQLATASSPVAPRSYRSPGAEEELPLPIEPRDRYGTDATYGLRLRRQLGNGAVTALAQSGPMLDPVLAATAEATLRFPRRRLYGVGAEWSAGALVFRFEANLSPDEAVSDPTVGRGFSRTRRWSTGVAVDWNTPGRWFVNLQLGEARYRTLSQAPGVAPDTQTLATLMLRRSFGNDRWLLRLETQALLSEGDGLLRPSIEYQLNDRLSIGTGIDQVYGSEEQPFGQFRQASRAWLRLRWVQ
ncbi:MAG: hypothetical protein AAF648_09805 [Pseudomonadota bacterium]